MLTVDPVALDFAPPWDDEDRDDPLAPAYGCVFAVLLMLAFWGLVALLWWAL